MEKVIGQFENTQVGMRGEFLKCDPSLQQEKDDKDLLLKEGDSYTRVQKGSIVSSDGETKIDVDLMFTRKRNANGGVDVVCTIPCLASNSDTTFGRG